MRDNGSLTGHEIELRDAQFLISRTDTSGLITFVNQDFAEINGFGEDELIGQPHDIVRHPDMPAKVFADLWADIKAGRPWIGMIRNRCKNGDEYWVEAHVSPIWENETLIGYMSMCRKASRAQIASAARIYDELKQGKATDLVFEHGIASRRRTWSSLRRTITGASLGSKLILASLVAAIAVLSLSTYLLATHLTRALDDNARHQLAHGVGLLRAAVASRLEGSRTEAFEYARLLNDQINDSLGGQHKATRAGLEALLADNDAHSGQPLDTFLRELRGPGSIFLLTAEGFQRRVSTARDAQGNTPIGSYLTADHPAYHDLITGRPHTGQVIFLGRQYLATFMPLVDANKQVIGATVVGIDLDEQLRALNDEVRNMQVGASGYYYIIDATPGERFGQLLLHPHKEGKNLADFRSEDGIDIVSELTRMKSGELSYRWKNEEAGETQAREKLVIFQTLDNPRWVIAGGTSVEEFTALTEWVVWVVVAGGLAMVAAIFIIIVLLMRRLVLTPLNTQILPTMRAIASGHFDTPLDVRGSDEIAQLIQGLESLRNRLAYEQDRERTLGELREQARREAEELAKARADFLANMSHEIRTPLNGVIGLAYLLMQSQMPPREKEYARRIEGAGKLLLGVVNDILDFSKIDAGGIQLEVADFRLDDILDNVSNLLRNRVQEKKLLLEYVVAPDVPQNLRGDALRLTQIFINLIGNAIKFTASGSITLNVSCAHQVDGRAQLSFRIQDTGIGMTHEQMAGLFQPFTQADSSVTRKFGGTGLGLVITKRLIEMMGGSIQVDSTPRVGSTFSFHLYLEVGQPDRLPQAPANYRVLVVDDNALARQVLAKLLEKHGCSVETDDSGSAALNRLRQDTNRFDCIMIDLNMPGIDGLALAGMIRSRLGRHTRLVMITADNPNAPELHDALGDFDEVIEKPVTYARLAGIFDRLRGEPPVQALPGPPAAAPLAGARILVAEDVPTNQMIMRDLLESLGVTVSLANNGRLAIEMLNAAASAFDLILMDIQMPEMDGLEATRLIRKGSVRPDIPIIALTAHALEHERQKAIDAGMNDFLTKPIDPCQLIRIIQRFPHAEPAPLPPEAYPATTPPSPDTPPFPEIAGIDTGDGLRRMMHKPVLYERVLRDFRKRFTGEPGRIRDALAAGDHATATRLAHSLKGTGGTIGAIRLASLAKNLEEAMKESRPAQDEILAAFEDELEHVLASIEAAFPST
ncbi:response regulator [Dechloromonas sp. CZR5]|uniref:response regulator n=1 Tax=Dechloromonas sp. CZR5 TaxID=2608630 RepID=UPI00123E3C11|nr:response regulator [Dechloromonas sp. CZR5]